MTFSTFVRHPTPDTRHLTPDTRSHAMPRPYDIITFDCYGTLIDWDGGITSAFRDAALTDGLDLDGDRVLAAYHAVEPMVQTEEYRPYRDVLADTARRCAERLDWFLPSDRSGFLAESLGNWTPFAETNKALEFDRAASFGMRLDIPSGTAVRFEPGARKRVTLVEFGGTGEIYGLNSLTDGSTRSAVNKDAALRAAGPRGFKGA